MEDDTHAITNSAASAEPIHNSVGQSFVHSQHHNYPPVVHNIHHGPTDPSGSGEPVVVHQPGQEAQPNAASAGGAADVTAQVAQAIAASAPAYMQGYAVDPSHHHHVPYAHHHHDPPTAATGMEYMAYAAATAMPGPEMGQTATTHDSSTANGYTVHQTHHAHAHPQQHQQNVEQTTTLTSETYFHQCTSTRQTMDLLLKDQKQAQDEVATAEDELARAKERLEKATQNKTKVDGIVTTRAKALTDELLNENSRWNEMYSILVDYKELYGHCRVMRNPGRKNKSFELRKVHGAGHKGGNASLQSLGQWVGQVRLDYRRPVGDSERLEPYKIIALEKLGFDWQPRENYWTDMYEELKIYRRENGGKMPPRFINGQKNALGQWCDTQLDNYRKFKRSDKGGYITQEKIDKLNEIGFIWDRRGNVWRENYDRLKEFKETHGHCNATASHNGGDKSFGTWVTKQKRKYLCWQRGETKSKELSLTDEQAMLMDAIEFVEAVEMDGRKMRGPIQAPNNKRKYSLLNNNAPIAGLMNATEEIAAGLMNATEDIADHHVQQQPQPETLHVEEEYEHNVERIHANAGEGVDVDTNYNAGMDSSTIVNTWGDSANAVSLLVDAMMNREGPN